MLKHSNVVVLAPTSASLISSLVLASSAILASTEMPPAYYDPSSGRFVIPPVDEQDEVEVDEKKQDEDVDEKSSRNRYSGPMEQLCQALLPQLTEVGKPAFLRYDEKGPVDSRALLSMAPLLGRLVRLQDNVSFKQSMMMEAILTAGTQYGQMDKWFESQEEAKEWSKVMASRLRHACRHVSQGLVKVGRKAYWLEQVLRFAKQETPRPSKGPELALPTAEEEHVSVASSVPAEQDADIDLFGQQDLAATQVGEEGAEGSAASSKRADSPASASLAPSSADPLSRRELGEDSAAAFWGDEAEDSGRLLGEEGSAPPSSMGETSATASSMAEASSRASSMGEASAAADHIPSSMAEAHIPSPITDGRRPYSLTDGRRPYSLSNDSICQGLASKPTLDFTGWRKFGLPPKGHLPIWQLKTQKPRFPKMEGPPLLGPPCHFWKTSTL